MGEGEPVEKDAAGFKFWFWFWFRFRFCLRICRLRIPALFTFFLLFLLRFRLQKRRVWKSDPTLSPERCAQCHQQQLQMVSIEAGVAC